MFSNVNFIKYNIEKNTYPLPRAASGYDTEKNYREDARESSLFVEKRIIHRIAKDVKITLS